MLDWSFEDLTSSRADSDWANTNPHSWIRLKDRKPRTLVPLLD